jgi:hypothetical protein
MWTPLCWRTATWWTGSSPTGARAARSAQAGSTAGNIGMGHSAQVVRRLGGNFELASSAAANCRRGSIVRRMALWQVTDGGGGGAGRR